MGSEDQGGSTSPNLTRSIGFVRASAIVVGIIIGASIFVQPSQVTGAVPSRFGVLAVWLLSGLLTLIGALIVAELSSAWPRAGGVYVFLRRAYSPSVGFTWGWAMFWTMHTGIIAVISMVFARYVGTFVQLDDAGIRAVAIVGVALLSAVNYVGVRPASAVQALLTFIKVFAIVILIGAAFIAGGSVQPVDAGMVASREPTVSAFVTAMIAGLFSYGGWHMVSYSAEETVDPARTIPRALLIGTILVTLLYVTLNWAYLHVLPLQTVANSSRVAADLAGVIAPNAAGAEIISVLVILSTLGALNGVILAGPRVYYAMARDGLLPRQFGSVHAKFRTPHLAITLQAVWASFLIATNTYRELFTRVVYTEWLFFAALAVALYFLRRRADYQPEFRLSGHRIWCALFIAASLFIVITQIINEPGSSITGLLFVLSGFPVFYLISLAKRQA